jgi:hypothetical protein
MWAFINKDGLKHLSYSTCLKINYFIVSRLHVIDNNSLINDSLKQKFDKILPYIFKMSSNISNAYEPIFQNVFKN